MSLSGIVGSDSSQESNRRFASACNILHLIASIRVLEALHEFQDEIRTSNPHRSAERHDELLTRLIEEIRADLQLTQISNAPELTARLWCSGANDGGRDESINVAVAEKLSALRTEEYFRERASRADIEKAKRILKRAGKGNPPVPGDEIAS